MSTLYQQYIQNVEFLNQKHERDSNEDIEVIIEKESTTEKLKQLVNLLKIFFDVLVYFLRKIFGYPKNYL